MRKSYVKNMLVAIAWAVICVPFALACVCGVYMLWDTLKLALDGFRAAWLITIMWTLWSVSSGIVSAVSMANSIQRCFKPKD